MNIQFGSGVLYGKPVAGNLPVLPTPFKFGVLQECSVDFKGDLKKLFGQYQFPVATARGKVEVNIKGKLAVFDMQMVNQLYWAQAQAQGYNKVFDGGLNPAAAINANVVTVTNIPIVEDWGVQDGATGQDYLYNPNVAALTGFQYFVNLTSGVYTFPSTQNGLTARISYTYFVNTNSSITVTLANQLMGYAPELEMLLYNNFRNKYLAINLFDVTLGTINAPTKLEDFWISDFDGSANANAANLLGLLMADTF